MKLCGNNRHTSRSQPSYPTTGRGFVCFIKLAVIVVLTSSLLAFPVHSRADADIGDSLVKIYTVQKKPYYYAPWNMLSAKMATGSGCIIEGRRILTNAHVVSDHTFIQVRRHGQTKKYAAQILAVSHEADLALLTVDDLAFFTGVEPLTLGLLPETQQDILVYGFPQGGDTMSITKGVVSRIEHQTYVHSQLNFLAIQLDAAINQGNSGGPAVLDGRIIGVVMQFLSSADNIGYLVPVLVVQHFLTDLEDGRYDGFPALGVLKQTMENESLRKMIGLGEDQSGTLAAFVVPGSPAEGKIKPGDVILSVDGHDISNDGTVEFRPKERTNLNYYVEMRQVGEKIDLDIWRDGRDQTVQIVLDRAVGPNYLVPRVQYDVRPTYYIYGGLIFTPLNQNYLKVWGKKWYKEAPPDLLAFFQSGLPAVEGEEVVVLLRVLPADVNTGYHDLRHFRIEEVNNQKINNLKDLIRIIEENPETTYVTFKATSGLIMALDREQVKRQQPDILRIYDVPSDRSPDLRRTDQ